MLKAFADGRLFGRSFGSPPARVLALHGWRRSHADFAEVLQGLDAVAVDLPGFGVSAEPPEPWGTAEYAAAVAPLLDEMGPAPVLLGHSFGGRVAVHLAVREPGRIGALVLTGVPLLRRGPGAPKAALGFRIGKALHRRGLLGQETMEQLRRRHGSVDYREARGVMRGVHVRVVNESYEDQLRAIRCPVELVWGDDDDQVPVTVARAAADLLADARVTEVAGAGHLTPLSAAAALRQAVERNLR